MKKFRTTATLALLASTTLIAGCEKEEVSSQVFRTEDQCLAAQPENSTQIEWEDYCAQALAQARSEHAAIAPRYESADLCEGEFGEGQCTADDGVSFFMPLFMGYMMSQMFDEIGDAADRKRKYSSRPVYRQTGKTGWYTAKGSALGAHRIGEAFRSAKSVAAKPKSYAAPKVMTKTSVRKSGGFGARSVRSSTSRSVGFSSRSTGMSRGGFSST